MRSPRRLRGCRDMNAAFPGMTASLALLVALGAVCAAVAAGDERSSSAGASVAQRRAGGAPVRLDGEVVAFFYLWYGTPDVDGKWAHWDHAVLPHWTAEVNEQFPIGTRFVPPHELHSPYYPARGPYSSRDVATLEAQMDEMAGAGVTLVALSWWGRPDQPGTHDTQGQSTDGAVANVLHAAAGAGLRVAFHLEPYAGRSAESVAADVRYIAAKYGDHPAFRTPVYFVYDSYHIAARDWARILRPDSPETVRGSAGDGAFIALWLDGAGGKDADEGGFDGVYTYFAADGFSYGATTRNWVTMARFCREHSLAFVASVGPGYDDRRIRPWNARNHRAREGGAYYRRMWRAAVDAGAVAVSITSYNEWGEGTQSECSNAAAPRCARADPVAAAAPVPVPASDAVEPAVPHTAPAEGGLPPDTRAALRLSLQASDYRPGAPSLYLDITREEAARLRARVLRGAEL